MTPQERQWQESGAERMSDAQRRLLNSACGDLAAQISWHGRRLSKDDWRHLLCGSILGWRMMPGIDMNDGRDPGFIMLGGSSLNLSKTQATEAITAAFSIGDAPETQGLKCEPVRWGPTICLARWITEDA